MLARWYDRSVRATLQTQSRPMAARACLALVIVLLLVYPQGIVASGVLADRASPSGTSEAASSAAFAWQVDVVDGPDSVGMHSSLALDSGGRPTISYYDSTADALKLAYYKGSSWEIETVDADGGTYTSLVLDSSDRPHISYIHGGILKYAHLDGSKWVIDPIEILKADGFEHTSLALDSAGRPHISTLDLYTDDLKYAYHDGTDWQIMTVDPIVAPGAHPSLALDSGDKPHISYYSNGGLWYATLPGTSWLIEPVDTLAVGEYSSLALDSADLPHISYYHAVYIPLAAGLDSASFDLKYAYHDGSDWVVGTVDNAGGVGKYTSIALNSADHPRISYYDETNGALRYAYSNGTAWWAETVDNSGDVGKYTSLALDSSDQPFISYFDDSLDNLKVTFDVPLNVHNQAAQLLEEMRGTPMAPGWDMAQLGTPVRPLYRPDVDGPAYYEFPVVDLSAGVQATGAGFIIISTDDHDFTAPHWNFEGPTPSEELRLLAVKQGKTATKFYKLDALAYAAENDEGELVATLGQQPAKISGLDPAWLDQPDDPTEGEWVPDESEDDSNGGDIGGELIVTGPAPPPALQLSAWASWEELKSGYGDSYGVLAEKLHREASEEWEAFALMAQEGEDLRKGDVRLLAMLHPTATVTMSGTGTTYVQGELVERTGLPPVYQLTVLDSVKGEAIPLDVTVAYANDMTQVHKFRVVDYYVALLPIILRDTDGASSSMSQSAAAIDRPEGWKSWQTYWAGSHSNQRLYDQIAAGTPPNTSGCWSGCGGTAWAMLFGWADYQASIGNSYWAPRWGLYRQNGGYGADAVAPRNMDAGVRNMTWEIRNRIQTWCIFGSGATWPWKMDNASGYLSGRTGTSLSITYSNVGIPWPSIRNKASSSIKDLDTPAVIGTGWLEHYPLAYGYKYRHYKVWGVTWYTQRKFYVNQGWGGSGNGWVSASTWFAGRIFP